MNKLTLFFVFCIVTFHQIESSSKDSWNGLLDVAAQFGQFEQENQQNNSSRKRSLNINQSQFRKRKTSHISQEISVQTDQNLSKDVSVQTEAQNLVCGDDIMNFVNSKIQNFQEEFEKQESDKRKQEKAFKRNIEILAKASSDKDKKIETLQQSLINAKFLLENNQKKASKEIHNFNEDLKAKNQEISDLTEIGRVALDENQALREKNKLLEQGSNHFKNATFIQGNIIQNQYKEIQSLKATLASIQSLLKK